MSPLCHQRVPHKASRCLCKSNFISSCAVRPCEEKKLSQTTHNRNQFFPPCASKNTPTLGSPTETGYPLASNSLPLARRGCALPSANNIKSFWRVSRPSARAGAGGMLARNGYHLRSAPLRCQLAQPPLPSHSLPTGGDEKIGIPGKTSRGKSCS